MTSEAEILFGEKGGVGIVTLNRPRALNALNTAMCRALDEALLDWAERDSIRAVMVEGRGDKAFCAGGDVRTLVENGPENTRDAKAFFATEYRMNARIFHFPKPYIAFMDGIAMGGGVGVSVHGSHRIVTERTLFAMPETGIGLIPDVGGSYFLPRLPGRLGRYLGLTGARLKAADALYAGIGTAYVPSDRLADLKAALVAASPENAGAVDNVIAGFAEDPGPAPLDEFRDLIDAAFDEDRVEDVYDHLDAIDHDWARKTLGGLRKLSPTSEKLVMEQLARGAALDFDDCLKMEYRLVNHLVSYRSDFFEGVRAVLIDKDHAPRWSPAMLEEVSRDHVLKHFEGLGERELTL